MAKDK